MLLSAVIAISAATCTVKTLRVMPTYTAYQETCVIQTQGKAPHKKVTVFRVNHPDKGNGSVPNNFVIPVGDR